MSVHRAVLALLLAAGGLAGCKSPGPDINPQAFQTAEQAAARRRAQQTALWQRLAATRVQLERPDINAAPAQPFALAIQADGCNRVIDLSPLIPALELSGARAGELLWNHIRGQLPEFDQARLRTLGFAGAGKLLAPRLLPEAELDSLQASATTRSTTAPDDRPHGTVVVAGLAWAPVVRWPGGDAQTPITGSLMRAWGVRPQQVEDVAMANLRGQLDRDGFTTSLPDSASRVGSLRGGVNPAVILLPEFLRLVRNAWQTDQDLLVLVSAGPDVRILEMKNARLMRRMVEAWQARLAATTQPLARLPLLLSDKGLAPYPYPPPQSRPATAPATRHYIVR